MDERPSSVHNRGVELFGQTLAELAEAADRVGLPSYGARQIAHWLYVRHVERIEQMTNLSRSARDALAAFAEVGRRAPVRCEAAGDGTRKYLFPAGVGEWRIETAVIPDGERRTLCLSTQIGCRRACRFCMTGRAGFHGNLSAGGILNQFASLPEREQITNIVFMGMGEPLDNAEAVLKSLKILTADYGYGMSPTRLTVSTVGIQPGLERLIAESHCHIALSVHSPFPEERRRLVPAEAAHPLAQTIETLRQARIGGQRRLTIEYIPFEGVNDTPAHAAALARLLRGLRCRINLIPFNAAAGIPLKGADRPRLEAFQSELRRRGFTATIRKSKGADIAAACGLLARLRE
jgi:23S rRNA (adenine2503-C2)-methyltransferase